MQSLRFLLLTCLLAGAARPTGAQTLLFHAPLDGSVTAKKAKGDRNPIGRQGEPVFAKGVFGAALQTGATNSFLFYDASQNIRGDAGTVSVWVQPNWEPDDDKYHLFWTFIGNGVLNLYKFGSGNNKLIFLITGRDVPRSYHTTVAAAIDHWKPGQPHHLAATWAAGTIRLYVDGALAGEATDAALAMPDAQIGVFFVGDYYHPSYGTQTGLSGQADTLIRDLRIYGQVLTAAEIAELAGLKKGRD